MTLTKLCKLIGWPRKRRWSDAIDTVQKLESAAAEDTAPAAADTALEPVTAIKWPEAWSDRGAVRRFDDTRNYPAAAPGIIYARRIAELLNYPIERVLKYHMLHGPEGSTLPDWWERDRYDSLYCTEEQAVQIVARIRYHRGGGGS